MHYSDSKFHDEIDALQISFSTMFLPLMFGWSKFGFISQKMRCVGTSQSMLKKGGPKRGACQVLSSNTGSNRPKLQLNTVSCISAPDC